MKFVNSLYSYIQSLRINYLDAAIIYYEVFLTEQFNHSRYCSSELLIFI